MFCISIIFPFHAFNGESLAHIASTELRMNSVGGGDSVVRLRFDHNSWWLSKWRMNAWFHSDSYCFYSLLVFLVKMVEMPEREFVWLWFRKGNPYWRILAESAWAQAGSKYTPLRTTHLHVYFNQNNRNIGRNILFAICIRIELYCTVLNRSELNRTRVIFFVSFVVRHFIPLGVYIYFDFSALTYQNIIFYTQIFLFSKLRCNFQYFPF